MRVTTLKATAAKLPGLLAYYAGLAEDRERPGPGRGPVDYYLDPDEPPGRWTGGGRHALGLDGNVEGADLRSLLEAAHPGSGARLGRRFGDSSARGFDATFSAPKSVSVLWALSPDAFVRAEVLAAHDAAVHVTLGWFERHGAVTRRGTNGVLQGDTLGITAAVFRQHTSRTVDPQLHSHAIISAKVQDETGRWLALDARFLKYQQRTIGWVYDAALRSELTARLGVAWVDRGEGVFDQACVPETVREAFSSRTAQVEAKLDESLRIPEEAKRSGDMSFLAGCWASITTLVNQRTGAPIVAEYCFDENGFGRSIRTEPNTQCVGPMRARFDDQGSLTVEETEVAVCGDGRRYTQTTVTCSPGQNGIAQCTGVNRGSRDAYTVRLQRKDSRPAGGESPQTPDPNRPRP